MEFKAIASMSNEVKEWFARAIVDMILADGRIIFLTDWLRSNCIWSPRVNGYKLLYHKVQ